MKKILFYSLALLLSINLLTSVASAATKITTVKKYGHAISVQKVYTSQKTSSKVLGSLKKNQDVYINVSQNGWYQINYGKTKGWVIAKYFKLGKYVPPAPTLGKKGNWINIVPNKLLRLNGAMLTFTSKQANAKTLFNGLDNRIKRVSFEVVDSPTEFDKSPFSDVDPGEVTAFVPFKESQKTKNVYVRVVFYDTNRKPILYQEQTFNLTKFEVEPNSSMDTLDGTNHFSLDEQGLVNLKVQSEYFSVHGSLNHPLSVADALKQEQDVRDYGGLSVFDAWDIVPQLSNDDYKPMPNSGRIYLVVIMYDKNLKPISNASQSYDVNDLYRYK